MAVRFKGVLGSNLGVIIDEAIGVGAGIRFRLARELLAVAVVQPNAAAVKVISPTPFRLLFSALESIGPAADK